MMCCGEGWPQLEAGAGNSFGIAHEGLSVPLRTGNIRRVAGETPRTVQGTDELAGVTSELRNTVGLTEGYMR